MKETLVLVITSLIRRLVGVELWDRISVAVAQADTSEATGPEKRAQVYDDAKTRFAATAGWMIGLAIEAAVARRRTQP